MLTEQITKTYAPWVGLIAIVVTAVVTFWQYDAAKARDRRAYVFELVKSFQSSEIFDARSKLQNWSADQENDAESKNLTPEQRENLLEQFASRADIRDSFRRVISYYDEVALCVASSLCDKDLVKRFFFCDMRAFHKHFHAAIAQSWRNHERDGLATDDLVRRWDDVPCPFGLGAPAALSAQMAGGPALDAAARSDKAAAGATPWSVLEILGALFTGVIALFAILQYREFRRSSEKQLRAYVYVDQVEVLDITVGKIPHARISIKNSGQTPAFDLTSSCLMGFTTYPEPTEIPPSNKGPQHHQTLGPGSSRVLTPDLSLPLTQSHINALASGGGKAIYIIGELTYRDAFNNTWVTEFRLFTGGPVPLGSVTSAATGNSERKQ